MKETPTQLRHVLRLIHTLQKERGVSVAHYAYTISHPAAVSSHNRAVPLLGIGASLNIESSHSSSSSASTQSKFWSDVLVHARQGTDVAFHMNISLKSEMMSKCIVWIDVLRRVRNRIDSVTGNSVPQFSHVAVAAAATATAAAAATTGDDADVTPQDDEKMIGPHRVIVLFNILIGNVIDEMVHQVIHREMNWMKEHYGFGTKIVKRSVDSKKLRPSLSAHNLLIANQNQPDELDQKRCSNSSQNFDARPHMPNRFQNSSSLSRLARSMPLDGSVLMGNDCYGHPTDDFPPVHLGVDRASNHYHNYLSSPEDRGDNIGMEIDHCVSSSDQASEEFEYQIPIHPSAPAASYISSLDISHHTTSLNHASNSTNLQSNACQIRDLLSLLLSFTQLKESTGAERSIVCCLMALSSSDEESYQTKHNTSKLFSDLVVEEENQRMLVRELQNQSKVLESTSLSLLQMVEKFLRPGREMEHVHDMIKTFDLEGLQKYMKVTDFWPVITYYIDQLHALELLIVEELQLSREVLFMSVKKIGDDDTNRAGGLCSGAVQSGETMSLSVQNISLPSVRGKIDSIPKNLCKDAIFSLLRLDSDISESDAVKEMSKMPAEQIKQRILQHIQGNDASSALSSQLRDSIDISEEIRNSLISKEPSHNFQEWQIDLYEIEFCERIGTGVAGTTYLAKWSDQQVAVKVAAITDLGLEGWVTEVHSLKRLHHPNVIRLLGSIYNPSPQTYGLVLEYCNSGDLSESLHYPTPPNFFWKIAKDVANGMSYLHRKSIMHRDIKPANILLDGDVAGGHFSAKLTDFGVAVMHSGQSEEHTAETGTYRWMAPEVIRHESYSFMADVYSYALVVWQLVTHEIPFENISQIEAAGKVAIDDARPPFPHATPHLIMALIERCWSNCPNNRLSFAQITVELKNIHEALTEKDKSWLGEPEGQSVYDVQTKTSFLSKGSRVGGGMRSNGSSLKEKTRGSSSSQTSRSGSDLFSEFLNR